MPKYDDICRLLIDEFEISVFREHISECEFPDEMEKLLDEYSKTKEKEIREVIETEYSVDLIKEISFKSGSMWFYLHTIKGRIETAFKLKKICPISDIKVAICFVLIASFVVVYQMFFRYKYQVYKGKMPYTAEIIKVDRLTGKSIMTVIKPINAVVKKN